MKNREVWGGAVHGVTKSQTRLSGWTTEPGAACRAAKSSLEERVSPNPLLPSFRILGLDWWSVAVGQASLVAQMVKNPPAMQETQVWFLGQENPLEEGMATLFSVLAWRIPWTEEPGKPTTSIRLQKFGHNWATKHTQPVERSKNLSIFVGRPFNINPPAFQIKGNEHQWSFFNNSEPSSWNFWLCH